MGFNASLRTGASVRTAAQSDDNGAGGKIIEVESTDGTVAVTNPTGPIVDLSVTRVRSLNGDTGDVTIGSSDGSVNVVPVGAHDIDITIAGGSAEPLSVASVKTTSGTARKQVVIAGDSLMAGNGGFQFSIVYWLIGRASLLPLSQQPGGFLNTWQVRGGEKILTPHNTAVGGTTTADALASVNSYLITPAPDGSDIFCNWGINDIIIAGLPPATSAANVTAILTAVFAARPNSRVHWISAMWGGGEQWGLSSEGVPQGINTHDVAIRATNAAIQAAVQAFPNARYLDVYTDMYRASAANNLPAPGLATGYFTVDGVHPGANGANLMAQNIFARITAAGGLWTKPTLPPSQSDMTPGNWYDEARLFMQSGIQAQLQPPLVSFNRYEQGRLTVGLGALPSGVSDASLEGGGLAFQIFSVSSPPMVTVTPSIYQTPKTAAFAIALDVEFTDPGESAGTCFVGLIDPDTTAPGNADALLFGIDPAVDATHFIMREIRAGAVHNTILNGGGAGVSTPAPIDHNRHCVMIFYDGGLGAGGAGIWDVYFDFQQVAHLNPSADFPESALALGTGFASGAQEVLWAKYLYMYNEPFCTPT
jgi:lysophospholipase L1-like esterase